MKKITLFTFVCLLCCNIAISQIQFQDVATSKGLNFTFGSGLYGGGVSFVDYDGDGWDDLTFASESGETIKVYRNINGTFQLVSMPFNETNETKQISWVDYDNDGDKDIFIASHTGQNFFYRNDGSNQFTDITSSSGFFSQNYITFGSSWGDFDNDGLLDVFIVNRDDIGNIQRNYLYKNNGDDTFTDVTISAGIDTDNHLSFCSSFFDYDNDGDLDIYVANDKTGYQNKLYRNNGNSTFTDVSDASGAGVVMDAMSTTIDDFDNDGYLDIYVTNTDTDAVGSVHGNALLKNNGDGTFTNVAAETGTTFDSIGWGAVFLDADNDTFNDLYVSGMRDGSVGLPSAFYENDGDDTFTIPSSAGFENDTAESYSNAIGDFNNDGKPDIVVLNETDNIFLWENQSNTTNNWLKLKLQGVASNRDGIGSVIEVFSNSKIQYRYSLCGEGYISQNSGTEIIGVGDATNIDYVKVKWLSGTEDVIENVAPNQTLTIVEGSTLSTPDNQLTSVKVYPNPTKEILTISQVPFGKLDYTIYDITGRQVLTGEIYSDYKSIQISNLSKGNYLLRLTSVEANYVYKFIKD